ncbi:metallophosphoesterase [Moraxella oblonga]|uniref:metallophosphoesterase n=1 Tax=Moraxella oblonga TaxID=200413 RepID=UPI00146FE589|nr:metallophosphoesterase [Moraxella oblonga]
MILLILIYSHLLKVVDYQFDDVGFKGNKNLNIALITDLHACYYGDNQKWLVDILKQKQPDVILLGGDIYDDKRPFDNADSLLSQLPAIAPTYYVDGNHENWLPQQQYNQVIKAITEHGVSVIHGKSIAIPNTNVIVHGISDPDGGHFDKDLTAITANLNKDNINILLSHRPERIDTYREYDFDVILSGHAHGGQWRVPFIINGVFAPNQGFLPKYAGGLYEFDDERGKSKFIVSRGLARESTRVPRIFNRPELVFITLTQS